MASPLPQPCDSHRGAYLHFSKRVHERVGPEEDATAHWWRIIVAVETRNTSVMEFMGRLDRKHRRLWRYHLEGPRPFYVVFDHAATCPITILTQDRPLRCGSRKQRLIIDGVAYGF